MAWHAPRAVKLANIGVNEMWEKFVNYRGVTLQHAKGRDGFIVSYNPQALNSFIDENETVEETALIRVENNGTCYFILNGDWRARYEPLIRIGFQACLDFYNSQKAEHGSKWTTPGVS